jgi:hypothetical protein|tara:strand:- start:288 stop:488 length:201 start_codon:yes stop_codon:yes gene_type:complete
MMKKFSFALMTIMIAAMEVVMSQPSLPSNPPQAPIDGGLGLLAAAGGVYAYKKLKDRKNQEENLEE